jgi:WD40-like Beta Propeller Repeat
MRGSDKLKPLPRRNCLIVAAALALSVSCARNSNLERELHEASSRSGLALVLPQGNRFEVVPFDGEPRYFKSSLREPLTVRFGKAGRMVLWYGQPLIGEMIAGHSPVGDATIKTVDGRTIKQVQLPQKILQFWPEALSEASGRLAFTGAASRDGLQTIGLYWGTFDFSKSGFVAAVDGHPWYCDWSPDGRFLAYDNEGRIYLFDVSSGNTRLLVEGTEPNWSPDGKLIAFRAPDGKAALVTTEGASVEWPVSRYTPTGAIRWSPDGRFVCFTESVRWHVPIIGSYNRLVVVRASHGEAATAEDFGALWAQTENYYWIVDYRDFCKDCQPELRFKPVAQ